MACNNDLEATPGGAAARLLVTLSTGEWTRFKVLWEGTIPVEFEASEIAAVRESVDSD